MKKAERLVFYFDLSISAHSRTFEAPQKISVRQAFELMELVPIKQRFKEMSKGRERLYVSDWKREGDIISILINKSDKSISDPVFTIPEENKRRTAEKTENEGQDFSVHIVVRLPENDLDPALFLIEHCSGFGVFVVQRIFNEILHLAKDFSPDVFEQYHPDGSVDANGKAKKYNVYFKCEFEGHISNDLKYDLDTGKIHSIELITEKEKHTQFDEDGYIEEKHKALVLTLKDEEHPIKDKFDRVKAVFTKKKEDYGRARIKFQTHTGVERTIDFDTANATAEGYVRKEKLDGFEIDLQSSYENFCAPILEKMKELL